eukprot:COSAG06_NODE_12915_length_1312_cov_6.112119_2_plen_42_part_01
MAAGSLPAGVVVLVLVLLLLLEQKLRRKRPPWRQDLRKRLRQ